MTLGQRIRALRTAKDLSQPEFAKMVGIEQILQITGVMLLVSGLLGFVLERRLPKLK